MGCEKVRLSEAFTTAADESFAASSSARLQACHTSFVIRQLSVISPPGSFVPHVVTKTTSTCSQAACAPVRQLHMYMVYSVDLRHVGKATKHCDAAMGVLQGMHGSTFAPLLVSLGPLQLQWRRWWKEQMQQLTQWCTALASLQRLST